MTLKTSGGRPWFDVQKLLAAEEAASEEKREGREQRDSEKPVNGRAESEREILRARS